MARQDAAGFSEVFEQAMDMFAGSFKAGIKFQEDMTKWWTGSWNAAPAGGQDWQKRSQAFWGDAFPLAQKQADEYLKMFDGNFRTSMELTRKMVEAGRAESVADAQARFQKLLDESMEAMRSGTRAMAEANVRAMQTWAELIRKEIQAASELARESVSSVADQAKAAAASAPRPSAASAA